MKIIKLEAQNIKNIKAIEVQANGKSVTITGKNEVGKSSVIDAITMTLTGKMVERPIREGEERAEVNIDLLEYKAKRVWTKAGNRLEVTTKDGAKYPSPQTLLNGILGQLSFDPLAFKGMDRNRQREILMGLVGLDFAKEAQERQDFYNERTAKNRMLGQYQSSISMSAVPEAGLPDKEISLTDEFQKIEVLEKKRNEYLRIVRLKEEAKASIEAKARAMKRLQDEVFELQGEINKIYEDSERILVPEEIEYTVEVIDKVKEEFSKIEITNTKIRSAAMYKDHKTKANEAQKEINDLTAKIESIDKTKVDKIKSAKYPIEGLEITDEAVLYKGIPFSDQSDGRKIQISTAIAMALNPDLRIILIREGSLLDSEARQMVIDLAKDKDYQLWIESVSDEKEIGVHIEG